MKFEKFIVWLREEVENQELSQVELASRSGLSAAHISRIMNMISAPSHEALAAIAVALHKPVEYVYKIAGVLPPEGKQDDGKNEINYIYDELIEGKDKKVLLETGRTLLRIQEGRGVYGKKGVKSNTGES